MLTGRSTRIFDAIMLYAKTIRATCRQRSKAKDKNSAREWNRLWTIEKQEQAAFERLLNTIKYALSETKYQSHVH